jgi:hypothetical protein
MNSQQPISWKPTPASVDTSAPFKAANGEQFVDNAAFKAVLERLENAARDLSRRSESLEDTRDLSGAVQDAAESLGDVLALRDSVLDAYRSAQQASRTSEEDVA